MLDSATAGAPPTDQPKAWWSAGLGPHEQGSAKPGWAEYVERSLALQSVPEPVEGDWQQALVRCLHPLLVTARDDLTTAGHTGAVTEQFLHRLGLRLVKLAARTLVRELAQARRRGDLTGATPALRFLDFTHRLVGGSELADLLAAYPVLARVLGEACRQSLEGHLELLTRLAEDRELIITDLLAGQDPGALQGVDPGGDPHRGGRCTATLTFQSGTKVVYKPRPLGLHTHFNEIVDWLNSRIALGLRTVEILPRHGYGWLEHIPYTECSDLAGVRRFYQRQGALLALLYVLDGTDMHYENLIAAGDQPVLVDVETLFHPNRAGTGLLGQDPAHSALVSSVSRTALLPLMVSGEHGVADLSGLGGDAGGQGPSSVAEWADAGLDSMHLVRRPRITVGARNRPRIDGVMIEPREHEASLVTGFQTAYEAIAWHRDELTGADGLLAGFANDQIRYVPRPSTIYATLLSESTHPDVLRTSDDRSRLLNLLSDADVALRPLVRTELADLWNGDIPLFTTTPSSRDVWSTGGKEIPDFLATEGLSAAEAKIAAMSEVDLHRQKWLISACLATRPEPVVHVSPAKRPGAGATEADPDQLLAAATDIADEIMAQVLGDKGGPANWLGLELLDNDHWAVLPMGAGLSSGYTGTALFLAQVGSLTGAGKYSELARDAIRTLPRLLEVLTENPESAQAVGVGLHGLGGISYGLHRLTCLLDDSTITEWLSASLDLMEGLQPDSFPSYGEGAAGGLAAVLAIGGVPAAQRLATRYADELLATVEAAVPAPGTGFGQGYAGLAWSLGRYGAAGDRYLEAARRAAWMDAPDQTANVGWCSGGAGSVLALLSADEPFDLATYLAAAKNRPLLAEMSLCHGELGAVEPLLWLAERDHPAAEAVRRRRAGLALAAVQQYGPMCGTPRAVPSPGFLTGLAGIGYGLLRLGSDGRIPSVLLQEPSPGSDRSSQRRPDRTPERTHP